MLRCHATGLVWAESWLTSLSQISIADTLSVRLSILTDLSLSLILPTDSVYQSVYSDWPVTFSDLTQWQSVYQSVYSDWPDTFSDLDHWQSIYQSVCSDWPVTFSDLDCLFWPTCHFLWSCPLTVYLSQYQSIYSGWPVTFFDLTHWLSVLWNVCNALVGWLRPRTCMRLRLVVVYIVWKLVDMISVG